MYVAPLENRRPAHIQWVATVAEVAEAEIIKQFSRMVGRAHVERILQQPGTGTKIDKRVPHGLAAGEVRDASAKFSGLLYFKAAPVLAFILFGIDCGRKISGFAAGVHRYAY